MRERERERKKTSPDFNDISNIHADAFCCFVLSFLSASSTSPARRTHPSLRQGRGMREKEGGKKQVEIRKTSYRASNWAITKNLLCSQSYLRLGCERRKRNEKSCRSMRVCVYTQERTSKRRPGEIKHSCSRTDRRSEGIDEKESAREGGKRIDRAQKNERISHQRGCFVCLFLIPSFSVKRGSMQPGQGWRRRWTGLLQPRTCRGREGERESEWEREREKTAKGQGFCWLLERGKRGERRKEKTCLQWTGREDGWVSERVRAWVCGGWREVEEEEVRVGEGASRNWTATGSCGRLHNCRHLVLTASLHFLFFRLCANGECCVILLLTQCSLVCSSSCFVAFVHRGAVGCATCVHQALCGSTACTFSASA